MTMFSSTNKIGKVISGTTKMIDSMRSQIDKLRTSLIEKRDRKILDRDRLNNDIGGLNSAIKSLDALLGQFSKVNVNQIDLFGNALPDQTASAEEREKSDEMSVVTTSNK